VIISEIGLNNLKFKERARKLQEEITERKLTEKILQESEERFRKLAEGSFEGVVLHEKGVILDANSQYYELFGYNPDELAGKDAISLTATPESVKKIKKQIFLGNFGPYEVTGIKKDGTKFPMEIRIKLTSYNGKKVRMAVIRDLTEQKQAEAALKKRTKELETKTRSLEELNTAMKILLEKREQDRKDIEHNILTNMVKLIDPYLNKIRRTKLDSQQKAFLNIMDSNLKEITSQFARKISMRELNLTPTEIKIANMIRHGNSSKEISGIMNISIRTVDAHRRNIRKKIGLTKKRTNLRSYLLSLH
jgi:PAS domain S-box-containing protein